MKFSGCGFSLLSTQVKDVARADGAVLWVTLDFKPVGTMTLRAGTGTMATYNMGRFGVSRDAIRVYSALPDIGNSEQILIGGAFRCFLHPGGIRFFTVVVGSAVCVHG